MSTSSMTMTLAEAVEGAKVGQRTMILCPAHADKNPSLAVAPGNSQPVVITCHAGCEREAIIEASGLDWGAVCNDRDGLDALATGTDNWTPKGDASHIYPYRDESGTVLYEVMRVPLGGGGKTFFQRVPGKAGERPTWKLGGVRRVPYRLPQLLQAVTEGRDVHIAEGEKDVHSLLRVIPEGDAATCNAQGAGQWEEGWGPMFAGAKVTVYADGDDSGRRHARYVRECLIKFGARVRILEAPTHKDVGDHLAAGQALEDMLETTPESMAEKARTGADVHTILKREYAPTEWAVEGTLAMRDRLLLVGLEGHGKSTLLRQIAVLTAAGIHPFNGREIEPKRVLYIDAENEPSQVRDSWSDLVGLCARHGREVGPGMLTVMEEWDTHPDLTTTGGKSYLEERLWAYRPQLTVLGPLTNLVENDLKNYEPVNELRKVVDASRNICGSAIAMEHHAPQRGTGDKIREVRPYGSSLFLKWPDFVFSMLPTEDAGTYEWHANRGPRVRGRHWPMALRTGRGGLEFPWMECEVPESRTKGR